MMRLPPILAFGFTSGWYLLGTALAAAPIIIHLLNRTRFRQVDWAAMEFLLKAERKNRRRIRIEHLILLAVRTLVVLLFVLGLARPYLESLRAGGVFGGHVHRVIVLDGSYSMQYRTGGQSVFDEAKRVARAILEQAGKGDAANLILMAGPPKAVVQEASEDLATVIGELADLAVTETPGDLAATLELALESLDSSPIRTKQLYLITDAQRDTFQATSGGTAPSRAAAVMRTIADRCHVTVVDVGREAAQNVAASDLTVDASVVIVGSPVPIKATVRNYTRQAIQRVPMDLWVDGARSARRTVSCQAGQEAGAVFFHTFAAGGDHTIEVRLPADALAPDDRRYVALEVKPAVNVLCINGEPNPDPTRGETFYLETALRPGPNALAPFRPHVQTESALVELDLDPYECIVLANVAQLTGNEARLLETYLKRGGSVALFLGDQVEAATYNENLHRDGAGPLPAMLADRRGGRPGEAAVLIDPLGYRHPIVQAFKDFERAGLLTAKTSVYYRLVVSENDRKAGSRVALAFAGGDPAVVVKPFGRGRVALVATSADAEWTLLPVKPSFLPVVHNLLYHLLAARKTQQTGLVGEAAVLPLPSTAADAPVTVTPPRGAGPARTTRVTTVDGIAAVRFTHTDHGGLYQVSVGPPLDRPKRYAVNVDAGEGDMAKLGREELIEALGRPPLDYVTQWRTAKAEEIDTAKGGDLYRWLFLSVLLLVIVESVLAWRFGHWRQS